MMEEKQTRGVVELSFMRW